MTLYGRLLVAPGSVVLYGYAKGSGDYLFVPEVFAEERSDVMRAFFHSETWGDYWRTLPEAEAAKVKGWLADWAESSEPEEASMYRPLDTDYFNPLLIPGAQEAEYPDALEWLALDWFPRELINDLGGAAGGPGSGLSLYAQGDGERLPEVEAVFARHGYVLVWDQERVMKASGWWWGESGSGESAS